MSAPVTPAVELPAGPTDHERDETVPLDVTRDVGPGYVAMTSTRAVCRHCGFWYAVDAEYRRCSVRARNAR